MSPGLPSPGSTNPDLLLDAAVAAFYDSQVEHAHLIQHLAATHNLNPVDLRALKFLGAVDDDRTPKELGAYLEMGTGAVTALLDRLTKRGLLERVRDLQDRRSVRIELTGDGFAVAGAIRAAYRKTLAQALPGEYVELFVQMSNSLAQAFRDVSSD